nr:acyl-CoA reductase [Saprospiraceae bacterium]
MDLNTRINLLSDLGKWILKDENPRLELAKLKSTAENPWFTAENLDIALRAVAREFLDEKKLRQWVAQYPLEDQREDPKSIAVIAAGNIPLACIHDLIAVFLSGHRAQLKLSSKDAFLLPAFIEYMSKKDSRVGEILQVVDKVNNPAAAIATGSTNTSRYFESYFKGIPSIIRKNRNSIAVLRGDEGESDFRALGEDIYRYFGLGCRSVSFLYVPEGYDFAPMMEFFREEYKSLLNHPKYQNNYEYNLACAMLNRDKLIIGDNLLLFNRDNFLSRIATLHYRHYAEAEEIIPVLESREEDVQCIATAVDLKSDHLKRLVVPPGTTQSPGLMDYADRVDTLDFLIKL